jgi:hypothetical protein
MLGPSHSPVFVHYFKCAFLNTSNPWRAVYCPCLKATKDKGTLKRLEKLSDQLDSAKESSEATTKEVQHARQTTDKVKRSMQRKRLKPHTDDGKSKAAVELGRKGGVARARKLTRKRRSEVAEKAAKARWKSH